MGDALDANLVYIDVLTLYVRPGLVFGCADAMVALDILSCWWRVEQ